MLNFHNASLYGIEGEKVTTNHGYTIVVVPVED